MSILVVAEHLRGRVRDITWEAISAAAEIGGPITVAAIAREPSILDLSRHGVDEVVEVQVEAAEFEADPYQHALEGVIAARRPEVVLLGFTVNSMAYGPRVATRLGLGYASDVFEVRREAGELIATRGFYGSKVNAELVFPGRDCVMLLLRPAVWAPADRGPAPRRSSFHAGSVRSRAAHRGYIDVPRGDVDITQSDFVLAVGRGIGPRENLPTFERLAERMGAALAVSRPLVDAGWMPGSRQVGQSGRTVKPKVYLAMGISGAVQHLAGMRGSGTVVAVNTDPDASIFKVADFGTTADLFEIAEELEKLF
jgi:electron transfer flavoprotein alpha subunit